MAKETNYQGKIYMSDDNKKIDPDQVKQKIGKNPISPDELAEYLTKYSRRNVTYSGKTIRRNIVKICNLSNGTLKISDFQISSKNKAYIIRPEYQGLLISLIDSRYLQGNKNDRKLGTREELYSDLIVNLETYLSETDLNIVKSNPAYINAKLESFFTENIDNQIVILMRELLHSDEVIRYQLLNKTLETLVDLNRYIMKKNAHILSSKLVYGHSFDNMEDGQYKKELLRSNNLAEYIIELLALKMHGKKYEYLSEDEVLSYPALWVAAQMYDIQIKAGTDAEAELCRISKIISDDEKFKELCNKAKEILDLKDPREAIMYNDIIRLSASYYLMPALDKEDSQKIVKFTESAIAQDKWDILCKFNSGEWSNSKTIQELRRIDSLRGLHQE